MEIFLRVFVNFEQNNWARLLAMVKLGYNNAMNASTEPSLFESICEFNPRVFVKGNADVSSKSKPAEILFCQELRDLFSRLQTQLAESSGTIPFSLSPSQPRLLKIAREVVA